MSKLYSISCTTYSCPDYNFLLASNFHCGGCVSWLFDGISHHLGDTETVSEVVVGRVVVTNMNLIQEGLQHR